MALSVKKTKPTTAVAGTSSGNTGAALLKKALRDELAPMLGSILEEQLKLGYTEELCLVDIEEICTHLGQLPASVKNTIRGFAVNVTAKGKVTVEFKRGEAAQSHLEKTDVWAGANPEADLRTIGGLALVTGVSLEGIRYKIEDNEKVTIQPTKPKQKAQKVNRFYILKVSNYWAGASSAQASD